jgi:hypothetical protein
MVLSLNDLHIPSCTKPDVKNIDNTMVLYELTLSGKDLRELRSYETLLKVTAYEDAVL